MLEGWLMERLLLEKLFNSTPCFYPVTLTPFIHYIQSPPFFIPFVSTNLLLIRGCYLLDFTTILTNNNSLFANNLLKSLRVLPSPPFLISVKLPHSFCSFVEQHTLEQTTPYQTKTKTHYTLRAYNYGEPPPRTPRPFFFLT